MLFTPRCCGQSRMKPRRSASFPQPLISSSSSAVCPQPCKATTMGREARASLAAGGRRTNIRNFPGFGPGTSTSCSPCAATPPARRKIKKSRRSTRMSSDPSTLQVDLVVQATIAGMTRPAGFAASPGCCFDPCTLMATSSRSPGSGACAHATVPIFC